MKKKIGIIGGGNMGEAILSRIYKNFSIFISEKNEHRARQLKKEYRVHIKDIEGLVKASDVIILAVKPQDIDPVLTYIAPVLKGNKLFISIAAGITTGYLEKSLGSKVRVIRTMPNMPALIGEGVTAIAKGRYTTKNDVVLATKIFDCVGETLVVKENLIDAITAVSGSGPAYVFLFAECLIKAAKDLKLSSAQAEQLVESTLAGSIHLLKMSTDDAGTLRTKVTSKGGTTQAAMDVFQKRKIEQTIKQALKAAKVRAVQLSRK